MNILKKLRKVNEKRSLVVFNTKLLDWSLPEWGNAVAGEVGEMCNIAKKIKRGDFKSNKREGIELLSKEMADIIIYIDLMAKRENINLEQAIINKFNEVSNKHNCDIKLKVMKTKMKKTKLINSKLLEALEWIEHHALQDGCSKKSLKGVASQAIKETTK